ncbi:hypothetical protein FRC18_006727 [Serendipita sp. 400]|nr:hypothetical protein FRC18_006727 [Serendipita sp. 400]
MNYSLSSSLSLSSKWTPIITIIVLVVLVANLPTAASTWLASTTDSSETVYADDAIGFDRNGRCWYEATFSDWDWDWCSGDKGEGGGEEDSDKGKGLHSG